MRACIDGSSYPVIAVLRELSNPNRLKGYSGAIQMLEETYGGTERLHHQVYQDVRDMAPVQEKRSMAYLISVVRSYQYDSKDAGLYNSSTLPELFGLIMQKLPETVHYEYKKQADAAYGSAPKPLGFLIDFLASQLRLMESDNHRKADGSNSKSKRPPKTQTHVVVAVMMGNNQRGELPKGSLPLPVPKDIVTTESALTPERAPMTAVKCILCCSKGHAIEECQVFLTMPIKTRRSYIGARGACYNCMRTGHLSGQCHRPLGCDQCQTKHHRLLHAHSSRNQNQGR